MRIPWQTLKPLGLYVRAVSGRENFITGTCIVAANHESSLDTVVLMLALRRPIKYIADHRLLHTYVRHFTVFTIGEAIPNNNGSIGLSQAALERGETIGVFPEGDVHPKYTQGRIHTGAVVLSHQSQFPIVPIRIRGTKAIWPVDFWPIKPWRLRTVTVTIGTPIVPPRSDAQLSQEQYEQLSKGLMRTIYRLS